MTEYAKYSLDVQFKISSTQPYDRKILDLW